MIKTIKEVGHRRRMTRFLLQRNSQSHCVPFSKGLLVASILFQAEQEVTFFLTVGRFLTIWKQEHTILRMRKCLRDMDVEVQL
jgi:hypothetical protein